MYEYKHCLSKLDNKNSQMFIPLYQDGTLDVLIYPSLPGIGLTLLLLLFWHAQLGVRSAIHRHQPPQRTVLSQVDCFVQCEVIGSQITLDGVQTRYEDALVVSSSYLVGVPLVSSWQQTTILVVVKSVNLVWDRDHPPFSQSTELQTSEASLVALVVTLQLSLVLFLVH